ncbi:MAG: AGE family epimerase/isomerase, partial [Lentisphaeria bacterium]
MTNFYSKEFLNTHIQSLIDFYTPNILNKKGGFNHNFYDDGTVFDADVRHLVSSCRMVYNYCKAHELTGKEEYLKIAETGLKFIEDVHYDATRNAYNWTLEGNTPVDQTNHCYGLAFVVLAHSIALEAGFTEAKERI